MKHKKREPLIYHTHDKLFKATFQDVEAAIDCIKYLLPAKIAEQIDLNNFKQDETHYTTRFLKMLITDVVYQTSQIGTGKNIALALLWEHKSNPYENICVQLLNYMSAIWQRDLALGRPLTAVIPIVFYHGEEKWEKQKLIDKFEGLSLELHGFVPQFDYHLISVHDIPDTEIFKLSKTTLLGTLLLMFKKIYDTNFLKKHKSKIFEFFRNNPEKSDLYFKFALYFVNNAQLQDEAIIETINSFPKKIKSSAMTTHLTFGERKLKEGIKEGIKEERKKNVTRLLLRGILSIPEIADVIEVPIAFVVEIRDALLSEGETLSDSMRDFKI